LRDGLDEAPQFLIEARSVLQDQTKRSSFDETLVAASRESNITEFNKYVNFAVSSGVLRELDEKNLLSLGAEMGLAEEDLQDLVEKALENKQAVRERDLPEQKDHLMTPSIDPHLPPEGGQPRPPTQRVRQTPRKTQRPRQTQRPRRTTRQVKKTQLSPRDEFLRILRMSGAEEEGLSEDQVRSFVNMGINLGLDEEEAEDVIDSFLDEVMFGDVEEDDSPELSPATINIPSDNPGAGGGGGSAAGGGSGSSGSRKQPETATVSAAGLGVKGKPKAQSMPAPQERQAFPDFENALGMEMRLVTSGKFHMGSSGMLAKPNEKPEREVSMTRFYMARFPVTNALYEQFDPSHKKRRMDWSKDDHPVMNVTSKEALDFCQWLTRRLDDGGTYTLPTEAQWEYAAKGREKREFPWGDVKNRGDLGNFADSHTKLAWSDNTISDGYAYTSPVGAFPKGAGPFGIEDMGGNVWEWIHDYYGPYKEEHTQDPRGPLRGDKRVCRGGSFRSKFSSMRCAARHFFPLNYQFIDLGFRVVRDAARAPAE
jgi:formylglycine-generating enzyme required for sulfatase activity